MSILAADPEETPAARAEPAVPDSGGPVGFAPDSAAEASGSVEPAPVEAPRAQTPAVVDGWSLVALVPFDGREPPAGVSEQLAQAVWCTVTALWHPSLLARAAGLPRIESVESPSPPAAREVRVVAGGAWDQLPSGYRTQAEDTRTPLLDSGTDRVELIRRIQVHLGVAGSAELVESEGMTTTARDFLAFGTVRWLLRDTTIAMGHADGVDHESLARELLSGAHAWQIGDWASAVNRLRAAFEVLTQARERFYPVDAYLIDLCLIDPAMEAGVLADPLASPIAISFIAPAQAIENQALHDPERLSALRQAINDGWADVAGGTYSEAEDPILPLESALWQFRRGSTVYRAHLDDRSVETFARRRFGLHTQVPQLARRSGFRFAVHLGFDAGRFPVRSETKRLWESPDGSSLESLLRPPMAADRASHGWVLPWRLAATMKNDHVAALPLVHWPSPVAPWYLDLRRAASYVPVLGRWTTLNDFFHLTDRPYETFRPEADLYQTPYLAQAAGRREPEPISRLARHHRLRARFEAARAVESLARAISSATLLAAAETETEPVPESPPKAGPPQSLHALSDVEELIETGRHQEAVTALSRLEPDCAQALGRAVIGASPSSRSGSAGSPRPGYLVFNPINVARRVAVTLPDAALDLRPEGPLRAAQFTDEGVQAVVDLPALGFAWVPGHTDLALPSAATSALSARGHTLKNESITIEVDSTTGGIRSLTGAGESGARLGQQLVITGLTDSQGKPAISQMQVDRFEVDYGGPALVEATSSGRLKDPRTGQSLAAFVERYRLWAGRAIAEIDITLHDLDPAWLERARAADPWSVYLACRWAWPDPSSMLRRTIFMAPELTEVDRPETPDVIDISTRSQRTALLFGGLPYHRKVGARMLDTLLLAGSEAARSFTVWVVLDLEHPFQAALDVITPAFVVPIDDGPPSIGASGWLAQIDHKGVVVSHVEYVIAAGEDHGWGLVFHLLETTGRSCRCRLRLFRNPARARQADFQGETVIDLAVDGDAVLVDLTPHELARIDVTIV
jgi:alpha-mannosidase